jgi:hypothetical protein
MWVFTRYGFYSAVCARQGDGGHGQPVDPGTIMVRGRVRRHLEALKERFPEVIGQCEIKTFPNTDYAFRIFVDKGVWSDVVAELAKEIDYDNYKSKVAHCANAG